MSEFWTRKMRTYFARIDFDKDGSITKNDFEAMADRFGELERLDEARKAQLREKLMQIWYKYLSGVGEGQSISLTEFIESMKKLKTQNGLKETLVGPLPLFFSAIDANADGMIQQDEFMILFELLGIDPSLASESFNAIDTNQDGMLSLEEFISAGIDFFLGEDESLPTKLFWGPLVP